MIIITIAIINAIRALRERMINLVKGILNHMKMNFYPEKEYKNFQKIILEKMME